MHVVELDRDGTVSRSTNRRVQVRLHRAQLCAYDGSLTANASALNANGLNAPSITATSSVRVASTLRSRLPGCGPCTKPGGWRLIEPAPIPDPARLMKLPAE